MPDTFQSSALITHNYGEENETTTEVKYTSGTATMNLFGRQVRLPRPRLENGEGVTTEIFIGEFKASWFYRALIDNG